MKSIFLSLFIIPVLLFIQVPVNAQSVNSPCQGQETFRLLDFWVGEWDVYIEDQKIGTNTIEKVVDGCAIIENWTSGKGTTGKSLFYYYPKEERWKTVM